MERSATRVKSATFIAPHSASLHAGYGFSHRIDLMSRGAIQVADLISARAPLEEGPGWFEKLYAHGEGVMKVVLEP